MAGPTRRWLACLVIVGLACPLGQATTWEDVATQAGLDFRLAGEIHGGPEDEWPAFPEIMGGGACWLDFDGDGYDDLFLVNQVYNSENPNVGAGWGQEVDPHSKLFVSHGDGTFGDVTASAGIDARGWGYGCSAADYDADGFADLFVANFGDNMLFHNLGDGTFANVSASSGVDMPSACGEFLCMSASSAWADYDHDGDLDLFVDNYVDTTETDLVRGPAAHAGQLNFLHRNEGDGTFTEVATQAGVQGRATEDGSKSLGVVWFDYDLDGDMDLFVANDETVDELYENHGDGTFTNIAAEAGVDDPRAGMGVASGDYDNDGLPDLFFTHYQQENNGFYRNNGDGTFEDRSGEDDLGGDVQYVGWGTAFVDWDRDMDLDIIAINGHTEATAVNHETNEAWYDQPNLVFRNDPPLAGADPWDREWVDVSVQSGTGMDARRVHRGAAFADYDLDGDVDIAVVNNANQSAQLLRATGEGNGFLYLQLRQPGMNQRAIGARVTLEAGGITQVREVQAGASYLSQNSLNLEFGLGSHPSADRVTVHWPGGGTTTLTDVGSHQVLRIDRSTGMAGNDTLSPLTTAILDGTGQDGWFRGPVEARLHAEDRGISFLSGVASSAYALGQGPWTPDDGSAIPFTTEGDHLLRVRSRDAAGNQEPPRSAHVRIDITPPVPTHSVEGEAGEAGWFLSERVTVTLASTDALSGPGAIRYRVDGGAWTPYEGPFDIADEGVHQVAFVAADRAGNEAPDARFEVKLDHTSPTVALTQPAEGRVYWGDDELASTGNGPATVLVSAEVGGMGGQVLTVRGDASDATSGLDRVELWVDGALVARDPALPLAWTWDLRAASPGLHEVRLVAEDAAGNGAQDVVDVVVAAGPAMLLTT